MGVDRGPWAEGCGLWAVGRSYNDDVRVFDRWLALSRHERRLAVEAGALTLADTLRVRLIGAPRIDRATASRQQTLATPDELRDVATAIARASRYIPGTTCLSRALALQRMLNRRGIAADIRLGVRTDAGQLSAHAWVECQGMTMNGPPDGDPFVTLR